jgi:hypothetical protein
MHGVAALLLQMAGGKLSFLKGSLAPAERSLSLSEASLPSQTKITRKLFDYQSIIAHSHEITIDCSLRKHF